MNVSRIVFIDRRKHLALAVSIIAFGLLLSACGKKTEQEQLDEVRDSFIYKNYRLASEKGLPLTLAAYATSEKYGRDKITNGDISDLCKAAGELANKAGNSDAHSANKAVLDLLADPELCKQAANAAQPIIKDSEIAKGGTFIGPDDLCFARVLLAYSEMTTDKPELALAETDLIADSPQCDEGEKQIATSLRAVIFHRNKWHGLAAAETEKIKEAIGAAPDSDKAMHEVLVAHAAFAGLAIRNENWGDAAIHIDALSLMLDAPWLSRFTNVGIAFKEKRIEDALVEIKALSQDPAVPKEVQSALQSFVVDIEKEHGNIDSSLFMERMITKIIWETAKSKGSEQWKALTALLDENSWADGEKAISSGMKVFRDLVKEAKKIDETQSPNAPTPQ